MLTFTTSAGETCADAVKGTHAAAFFGLHFEREVLAEHGFGLKARCFAMQHDVEFEGDRQRFGTRHLAEPHRVA